MNPRTLARLADFESAPFSHLGTSPYWQAMVLYQCSTKKSRFFGLLFCQFHHFADLGADFIVVLPAVGLQAVGAVLDAVFGVGKCAAALVAQCIQGTEAEQAAEFFRIRPGVAGEVFTLLMLEKIVICHGDSSFSRQSSYDIMASE